jgi:hypothetical protein
MDVGTPVNSTMERSGARPSSATLIVDGRREVLKFGRMKHFEQRWQSGEMREKECRC